AKRLPLLYERYPHLRIDLMLSEQVLDLPMREADVAIRMKEPSQADLIRLRLMSVKMQLYAVQSYLDVHGTPATMEDLAEHRLICQNTNSAQVSAGAGQGLDAPRPVGVRRDAQVGGHGHLFVVGEWSHNQWRGIPAVYHPSHHLA
ncbi:MAG: hypothetical protein EOM24_37240, partial [Chloroflexia bacterium]|nr:hypothetical protein [Chloroflexia bacterium]